MTLFNSHTWEVGDITVDTPFASTTQQHYFQMPHDMGTGHFCGYYEFTGMVADANIKVYIDHAAKDETQSIGPAAEWAGLLAFASKSANGGCMNGFASKSLTGLLPYGRMKVTIENKTSATTTITGLVVKLLTDAL